jgi:hypothetical protein
MGWDKLWIGSKQLGSWSHKMCGCEIDIVRECGLRLCVGHGVVCSNHAHIVAHISGRNTGPMCFQISDTTRWAS